jgi:N-acetylglucosaminyldiphosphoundecaprenol N-acetyl-beta-D-mannosaminyltransferase
MQRTNILGVGVSAVNLPIALQVIDTWIERRVPSYVCVTGVHGVMESQRDDGLRRIHNAAGMVTPDGMPMVWLSRMHGHAHVERVYGPDLMLAACGITGEARRAGIAVERYRHFLYGGTDDTLARLSARLIERNPRLQIVGAYAPPFRPLTATEDDAVIATINGVQPDLVWVGLSTPKQERWMAEHVGKLTAPALIGVGAAFDFHSGSKRQAPVWMQRSGLEWLYRLSTEPGRVWKRYLVNNPTFVMLVLAQAAGVRRWELED